MELLNVLTRPQGVPPTPSLWRIIPIMLSKLSIDTKGLALMVHYGSDYVKSNHDSWVKLTKVRAVLACKCVKQIINGYGMINIVSCCYPIGP